MLSINFSISDISATTVQAKDPEKHRQVKHSQKTQINAKKKVLKKRSIHFIAYVSIVMLLTAEQLQEKVVAASEVFRG